jgi:PiT family inorganic phosphate transporter
LTSFRVTFVQAETTPKVEQQGAEQSLNQFTKVGLSLFFLVAVLLYAYLTSNDIPNHIFLAIAAVFGGYMAMNIGANDVANNVGPAVGSKAITLTGAIIIAMIFEAAGAIIAGGDVVSTIKKGIIDISGFGENTNHFIWAMMSALLAAALWLNVATMARAPVSTTHSIVGGVMGAGIASAGFGIVDWGTMGKIASSWVISPVIGGLIAAAFLYAIKKTIIFKEDKVSASYKWVPIYVSIMAWSFSTYLVLKGLKKIWPQLIEFVNQLLPITFEVTKKPSFETAAIIGGLVAVLVFFLMKKVLKAKLANLNNDRASINILFTVPLIFAAALLSFAHGANDVANAIGPLAAINDAIVTGGISAKAGIPFWVMAVGAFGIAIGLALYGPRLIRTVGGEITELDQMRAFSIALAAAITVIIASQLGLPVSSTHIAIGGVFGVGFLREWLEKKQLTEAHFEQARAALNPQPTELEMLKAELSDLESNTENSEQEREKMTKLLRAIAREEKAEKVIVEDKVAGYVKRDIVKKVITAWLITVPSTAVLSACIFFVIKAFMS